MEITFGYIVLLGCIIITARVLPKLIAFYTSQGILNGYRALDEWRNARKALLEYRDCVEKPEHHASYKTPDSLEELLKRTTSETGNYWEFDQKFRTLLRNEREAFIKFLETNPSCIPNHKADLISILDEIPEEDNLWQRVMNLIIT